MDRIKSWRRALHQIPELGLEEYQTTAYLKKELEAMGYQTHDLPPLKTGVYVKVAGQKEEAICFRSDIDGLPITEENDVSYRSQHEGRMHACGHDGHMAVLLALAEQCRQMTPVYTLIFLFQPAEESPGGAHLLVESGFIEDLKIKTVYGIHLMPTLPYGELYTRPGALMAQCGELDLQITGRGAHAGLPHQGIDAILIAAELIMSLQSLVARRISPFEPVVLNIGEISGGEARNSVAEKVVLKGTVRTCSLQVFQEVVTMIDELIQAKSRAYHCSITMTCPPMYPALINDPSLYQRARTAAPVHELDAPVMLAEDFAYYGEKAKILFTFLGTQTPLHNSGLHTSRFDFDEQVLEVALAYNLALIHSYEN